MGKLAISPKSGKAGDSFSLTGSDFDDGVVVIDLENGTSTTVTASGGGWSPLTFTFDEPGEYEITAKKSGKNEVIDSVKVKIS